MQPHTGVKNLHEKPAQDCYFIQNSKNHSNFTIQESGLVINPKWSYIGTSPDSTVGCSCCGDIQYSMELCQ